MVQDQSLNEANGDKTCYAFEEIRFHVVPFLLIVWLIPLVA